jgi:hypothetical protein
MNRQCLQQSDHSWCPVGDVQVIYIQTTDIAVDLLDAGFAPVVLAVPELVAMSTLVEATSEPLAVRSPLPRSVETEVQFFQGMAGYVLSLEVVCHAS